MERIYMNQTALSLGYIALKRIRALEASTTRLPSNPLLRHLGHIKILAACVEQVGPQEIIEYEINQDFASTGPESSSGSHEAPLYDATPVPLDRRIAGRKNADDEVAPQRYVDTRFASIPPPLPVIAETTADYTENLHIEYCMTANQAIATPGPYVVAEEVDTDEDYSMDELYDEYNSQEDDWETASDLSDDDNPFTQRVFLDDDDDEIPHLPSTSRRISRSSDLESDDDDDIPATPPANSAIVSRSPPLDICMKHPITHELSKREQERRTADTTGTGKPGAFVEQIEDVLCHEIRCLSLRGVAGKARLDSITRQQVSLFA